ncbi:hypothetical protein FRB90_003753 [Tulasnella sp. 427]|nr:hypothetical protein FRB90_003753 [Tulasnella sp. 427]
MSLRRSTRTPAKRNLEEVSEAVPAPTPTAKRQRAEPKPRPNTTSLQYLLTNPRSKLCKVDIANVFSFSNWELLSEDARQKLLPLLPPTAFINYVPTIDQSHPSNTVKKSSDDAMDVDPVAGPSTSERSLDLVDPNFLKCHFLQSAARQFQVSDKLQFLMKWSLAQPNSWQDQIVSGFFTEKSTQRVQMYNEAVANGTAHARWKDDEWDEEHPPASDDEPTPVASSITAKGKARATPARRAAFVPSIPQLAEHRLLRPGDLLLYKRAFTNPRLVVQKHLLVQSINEISGAVTFLLPLNTITSFNDDVLTFPAEILPTIPATTLTPTLSVSNSPQKLRRRTYDEFDDFPKEHSGRQEPQSEYFAITTSTTSAAVESHILPLFDNLPPEKMHQPDASSSKCFTVWRWKDEDAAVGGDPNARMGGRQNVGTLYYLSQSCPRH